MTKRSLRLSGGLIGVVAVLALAACGSDDASGPVMPQDLVLSADELPAGFDVQDVPKDEIIELAKQTAASGGSPVTPASCKQSGVLPDDLTADQLGITIAQQGTAATLTDVVSVSERDIASFRAAVTGKCATVKRKVTRGPMAGLQATVTTKVLDAPAALAGKDVLVYQQTSTARSSGQKVVTKTLSGVAKVGHYVVRVEYAPMAGSNAIDRTAFDESFARAVDKVAEKA